MRIAVCDDNIRDAARLKQAIYQMKERDLRCDCFQTACELLQAVQNGVRHDLYILDIEMPDVNGIELAEKIRRNNMKAFIAFCTSYPQYVMDVFRALPAGFLTKPLSDDQLKEVIDRARSYMSLVDVMEREFSVCYYKNKYGLKLANIIYFEKRGRKVLIHLKDEIHQANMSCEKIWEQLDERLFAAVHGSYIVNLKHVRSFSKGMVVLTDGTELIVARGCRKKFGGKYVTFVRGGM